MIPISSSQVRVSRSSSWTDPTRTEPIRALTKYDLRNSSSQLITEIMPGVHQSLRNDASSSESEMAEDVKPTGLNLHEALDADARRQEYRNRSFRKTDSLLAKRSLGNPVCLQRISFPGRPILYSCLKIRRVAAGHLQVQVRHLPEDLQHVHPLLEPHRHRTQHPLHEVKDW